MIRKLTLNFDLGFGETAYRNSKSEWHLFLYESFNPNGIDYICFPSLEQLLLNFQSWNLREDDWLPVCPSPISVSSRARC